jgi:hypothetical protein
MQVVVGQSFQIAKLTGYITFVGDSGVAIEFARVSASGSTRTGVGDLVILYPCTGRRGARMMLAIKEEYHKPEFLKQIQEAVFSALGIPFTHTWMLTV